MEPKQPKHDDDLAKDAKRKTIEELRAFEAGKTDAHRTLTAKLESFKATLDPQQQSELKALLDLQTPGAAAPAGAADNVHLKPMQRAEDQDVFLKPMQRAEDQDVFLKPMQRAEDQDVFLKPMQRAEDQDVFLKPMQRAEDQDVFLKPMQTN